MIQAYCPKCCKMQTCTIKKNIINEFKGVALDVDENVAVCPDCQEELFDHELEKANLASLYNQYRQAAGIVSPEQITEFRERFGLSQRELTALLDWGKMTINRYERGAVPSASHNDLLKIIMANEALLADKARQAFAKNRITKRTLKKVQSSSEDGLLDEPRRACIRALESVESEFNGFRRFDIHRLINIIGYLADRVKLYKTSLNKYLWYMDFESYRRNVRSLTGTPYDRYIHGPVIHDFKFYDILNLFDTYYSVEEAEDEYSTTTRIHSRKNYDLSLFSEAELAVINSVIDHFADLSSSEISRLSHQEDAWLQVPDRQPISYEFAEKLKVQFS